MYKYIFRFVVTILTILTANLLTSAITDLMAGFKNSYKPLTFTLAGMAIIVAVFYPLFLKLEAWLTRISIKAVRSGSSLAGRYMGLIITFIAAMVILLYFYAKMWYHINIFRILFSGNIMEYF